MNPKVKQSAARVYQECLTTLHTYFSLSLYLLLSLSLSPLLSAVLLCTVKFIESGYPRISRVRNSQLNFPSKSCARARARRGKPRRRAIFTDAILRTMKRTSEKPHAHRYIGHRYCRCRCSPKCLRIRATYERPTGRLAGAISSGLTSSH